MLGFAWTLLTQPSSLLWLIGLAGAAGLAVYLGGGKFVFKLVTDARVWLAIGAVVVFLSFGDLKQQNDDLKARVDQAELVLGAKDDAIETEQFRADLGRKRGAEDVRIRTRIAKAPPDEKVDAALDEIESLQAENRPPEPDDRGLLDRLLDRKQPDGAVGP